MPSARHRGRLAAAASVVRSRLGATQGTAGADEALGWLIDASHKAGPDALPTLARETARRAGAADARIFLVDHEQIALAPLDGAGDPIPVDGTDPGRAFSSIAMVRADEDGPMLWAPLLDGTDRLGVVGFRADAIDDALEARCRQIAGLLAELVATRSSFGDSIEIRRRLQPMSLPAELLTCLLPPLTHTTDRMVISCILAPSYDVGGDAFDYAVDGARARFAIFDAMGHGLEASLLAAVTLASYRSARRRGVSLEDTYLEISDALRTHFGPDRFVTGVMCELDTISGHVRRINAGHPTALRVGADGTVGALPIPDRSVPFGVGGPPVVLDLTLEAGDRLLFYTDGVIEARDTDGNFFGMERFVGLVTDESRAGHPAPELLRRLALAISAHQKGVFQDDATTMIVEWLGPQRERTTI